jgi:Flp pilus assembly protein TadD
VNGTDSAALSRRDALVLAALFLAILLAYQPAWSGSFLWDDRAHVTARELRSWHGLWRIWFDPGATQQYYPLTHSVFWLEHRLWGEAPTGYHLVNIGLHFGAAALVALILRSLAVPGAYLAAAVFALHPVHVESVAWITELKNTLSAVLYLSAALAWLRFEETRRARSYALALALFVLALCSKTVTATLPAALLVVAWWRHGRVGWRRDVVPLLPFFVLGAGAGLFTVWVERHLNGAQGVGFELTFADRVLIAGRALWFYAAKLFWPAKLTFIYPRWHVDHRALWQYAYPAAAAVAFASAWLARKRGRGALAGLLFFAGTAFPALGFFDVYPFLFSFVADHFQYLASLGVITVVAAGLWRSLERTPLQGRVARIALPVLVLTPLTLLTWRQSHLYRDPEPLYRATIQDNPECWMAWNNLGHLLITRGELDEGMRLTQRALELRPDYPEARTNLAVALAARGRLDEAIPEFRVALRSAPSDAGIHYHFAVTLVRAGRPAQALGHLRRALELEPESAEAHDELGVVLAGLGGSREAIGHFRKALEIDPDSVDAHNNLGIVLARSGNLGEAVAHFRAALRIDPARLEVRRNLELALARQQPQ